MNSRHGRAGFISLAAEFASHTVSPKTWGVTTHKGNRVYVHVLNPEDNNLLIPDFGKKVRSITLYSTGAKLKYKQDAFGIAVTIPDEAIDEIDTILVIEI